MDIHKSWEAFFWLFKEGDKVDLFASPPAAAASSPAVDFFAAPEQVVAPETKPAESNIHLVDPFAAVPMNNFDTSDFFAKKVDLTDVGIVGGLSAGTEEKDKGLLNSLYMGRAMGTGSGLGKSIGYSTSATADMDDFFSSLSFQK
ncbi:clathrin interactor EPSIN 1 [Tanacetum coccineum]